MRRFDAILFDGGGTLFNFDGNFPEVLAEATIDLYQHLVGSGLSLDKAHFCPQFIEEMNEYYQERDTEFIEYTTLYVLRAILLEFGYPFVSEEILRPALKAFYAKSQAHWHAEADAQSTLEELSHRGYRLALISNASDDDDVQMLIDKGGFRHYFKTIITSAALGIRKPNPKIFLYVLECLGVAPERAVMVGDNLGADILGARNAGIYSIWITRRAETAANRDHEDTITPDAVIASLSEIPKILEELEAQR